MLAGYKRVIILLLRNIVMCVGTITFAFLPIMAQDFTFEGGRKTQSISFKFIKNLIIIPIHINNKGPFNFVLDTGVGPMIITDPTIIDSLDFDKMRRIKLMGLGEQEVEAYISQILNVKIGEARLNNIPAAVLKEDLFNLSGYLGLKIYGLIGYSFFNSFIVDVKYGRNVLKFSNSLAKVKYKGLKVPITIENLKPYTKTAIQVEDGKEILAKFLIDTGASHALSLEALNDEAFPIPLKKTSSNLGLSLSGQITGYLARVCKFNIGNYIFNNVIAGFPNYESISSKIENKRNGTIGAELLSRFNIQFNYQEGFMYIKPNLHFKNSFEHNMSGIIVYLDRETRTRVFIGDVDADSPAERIGLQIGDEILRINFNPVKQYPLNDIDLLFKSRENRTIVLEIYRNNEYLYKVLRLEKRI